MMSCVKALTTLEAPLASVHAENWHLVAPTRNLRRSITNSLLTRRRRRRHVLLVEARPR